ncbi:hypothetical protein RHMOL_Rhmol04G0080800 [Rhododendron molle]|uniref:Uncharacterized protein n=2 Tax=Rhododendron molle TaxID=49168 RepID=A0ACC0NZF9_RHOML|nr:hypothetical protein RHMOL_Rhmol04G0080800 [Rhododendron molle]KAI8558304.1 hypothetical protein RHMOL_Rhmol04G0080800 [Rhododendron molle]
MNRSTRSLSSLSPVNPPESRLFALPHQRRRSLPGIAFPPIRTTTPQRLQFRRRISLTAASARRRPGPTAMDGAVSATPPDSDFIRIDGPGSPAREDPGADDIEGLVRSVSTVDDEEGGDERGGGDAAVAAEDFGEGDGEDRREALPEEVWRSVVRLSCESTAEGGVCEVYLVGTSHVSQESCQEVEAVIRFLKPQVVFLELCSSRMAVLTPQNLKGCSAVGQGWGRSVEVETYHDWALSSPGTNHGRNGGYVEEKSQYVWNPLQLVSGQGMYILLLVSSKLEVFPGSEFRVAFEEALKYGGKVILGDRPVQITLRRTWAKMPLWHKTKLFYSLVFQAFFLPSPEDLNQMLKELGDVDMLTLVIQEMSKQFPTLMETIVYERDQYMSATLLITASEHSSVVAVVGKGHLQGIKKNWKHPVEMKDLLHVDTRSRKPAISVWKILTTVGVAVAGVAIVSGIYLSTKK